MLILFPQGHWRITNPWGVSQNNATNIEFYFSEIELYILRCPNVLQNRWLSGNVNFHNLLCKRKIWIKQKSFKILDTIKVSIKSQTFCLQKITQMSIFKLSRNTVLQVTKDHDYGCKNIEKLTYLTK